MGLRGILPTRLISFLSVSLTLARFASADLTYPTGGYAISIVANIGFNALSDWKRWRWQLSIFVAGIQVVALIPLVVWPAGYKVQFAFYYFTYATAAWG